MSKVILPFPQKHSQKAEVPTPYNYQPGDTYYLLEFEEGDVLPYGFFQEAKIYIRGGERLDGMIHALDLPEGVALSRLRFLPGERALCVPFMDGAPQGELPLSALKIVGWMDEVRPAGWGSPRIVHVPDEAAAVFPDLPIYVTSLRL